MKRVVIIVLSLSTACVLFWAAYKVWDSRRHADSYTVQEMGKTLAAAHKAACDAQRYEEAIEIVGIVKPFQIELATVFDLESNPSHVRHAPARDGTTPLSPEQQVAREQLANILDNYNKVLKTNLSPQQWKRLEEIRKRYRTEWLFVTP